MSLPAATTDEVDERLQRARLSYGINKSRYGTYKNLQVPFNTNGHGTAFAFDGVHYLVERSDSTFATVYRGIIKRNDSGGRGGRTASKTRADTTEKTSSVCSRRTVNLEILLIDL